MAISWQHSEALYVPLSNKSILRWKKTWQAGNVDSRRRSTKHTHRNLGKKWKSLFCLARLPSPCFVSSLLCSHTPRARQSLPISSMKVGCCTSVVHQSKSIQKQQRSSTSKKRTHRPRTLKRPPPVHSEREPNRQKKMVSKIRSGLLVQRPAWVQNEVLQRNSS